MLEVWPRGVDRYKEGVTLPALRARRSFHGSRRGKTSEYSLQYEQKMAMCLNLILYRCAKPAEYKHCATEFVKK